MNREPYRSAARLAGRRIMGKVACATRLARGDHSVGSSGLAMLYRPATHRPWPELPMSPCTPVPFSGTIVSAKKGLPKWAAWYLWTYCTSWLFGSMPVVLR